MKVKIKYLLLCLIVLIFKEEGSVIFWNFEDLSTEPIVFVNHCSVFFF